MRRRAGLDVVEREEKNLLARNYNKILRLSNP
jgi:hypothetical protein